MVVISCVVSREWIGDRTYGEISGVAAYGFIAGGSVNGSKRIRVCPYINLSSGSRY